MKALLFSFAIAFAPLAATAQEFGQRALDFLDANLVAAFYHELGHALIDQLQLPIFGQEEDAADVLSVILIDSIFDDEAATEIARDSALAFLLQASASEEMPFWDVHGSDLQRYYTSVCLFYGANPDAREDYAQEMELPEGRAQTCAEEFALASDSWSPVLEPLWREGRSLRLDGVAESALDEQALSMLQTEIDSLNTELRMPMKLNVDYAPCGQINAFYDPTAATITICSEFASFLYDMAVSEGL